MMQRLHVVREGPHWAIPKVACPTCLTAAGYKCLSLDNKAVVLSGDTVHVGRVKAHGYNVRV